MIYLDKKKIDLKEVKQKLIDNGWTKTSSKRFIRFTKTVNEDGKHRGIEINKYENFYELSYYRSTSLGFFTRQDMDNELKPMFEKYIQS